MSSPGKKITRHSSYLVAVVIVFLFATPAKVFAVQESLTISPLRAELKLARGQTLSSNVKIKNSGTSPIIVTLYTELFAAKNEQYDQQFSIPSDNLSADKWIHFSQKQYSLEPNQETVVGFQIQVPPSAQPGGHYVAIFAQIEPANNTTKDKDIVQIKRVASLLYFEVAGQLTKSARLTNFAASLWQKNDSLPTTLRIENTGNTHYRIDGWINLKTVWNSKLSRVRVNGLLLPGTTRLFETSIKAPRLPGIYKLQADIRFADQTRSVKSSWIVVLPTFWFVCFSLLIIMGIIWLSWQNRTVKPPRRRKQKQNINQS